MAIDIRANVTCSLGTLISATLSDDYIQGNGLIKTSGSCEISGLIMPAAGDVVTFSYTKNGISRRIPRKMRVLSSFADPFRRTTSIELGCRLTYLQDVAPRYDEDSKQSAKQLQCLNEYSGYSKDTELPIPFRASDIMNFCLNKLDLNASHNPLTNIFYKEDEFDYSDGYVNVLSDLLLSESYCGYLDYNETLQIFSLDQPGGAGPLIEQNKIIDVAKIAVGGLPGDTVIVKYNSLKFNAEDGAEPTQIPQVQRDWSFDESRGPVNVTYIPYTHPNTGDQRIATAEVEQYSKTITRYGEDRSWDENTCVKRSSSNEGPDLSDSVFSRQTSQLAVKGADAAAHCGILLSEGVDPAIGQGAFIEKFTEFEYNGEGKEIFQRTVTREPFFTFAGKTQLQFIVEEPQGQTFLLSWGSAMVTTQIEEIQTVYTYASAPQVLFLKENERYIPEENGRKVYRNVWTVWPHTAEGQQALAWMSENAPFTSTSALQDYYIQIAQIMVKTESSVSTSGGRLIIGGQVRPKRYTITLQESGAQRGEQVSEIEYITGSSSSERVIEFSMPYQSDDYITDTTPPTVIKGDAQEKARIYGRVQNKLLLGNRSGMNLQVSPEVLPSAPFEAFFLEANGLSALYRTNGTSWTMDNGGVVASTDALFWGGVGGTGNFWFPVAPGIVSLPSTPPVTDTSPDQIIGTIETVGETPQAALNAAFPAAINGDGVQDQATDEFWVYDGTNWDNVGSTPGPTIQATTVVPPWNEVVTIDATTRTQLDVASIGYPLTVTTAINPFLTYYDLDIRKITAIKVSAVNITLTKNNPFVSTGVSIGSPAIQIQTQTSNPSINTGYSASVGLVDLSIIAVTPDATGKIKKIIKVPGVSVAIATAIASISIGSRITSTTADISLAGAIPSVSTGTLIAAPTGQVALSTPTPDQVGPDPIRVFVPAANIAITGLAPSIAFPAILNCPQASVVLASKIPTIVIPVVDPSFASVALLMHFDEANGSTSFVDNSANSLSLIANGSAATTTSQQKFGTGSLNLTGSGTNYLSYPSASGDELDVATNQSVTVEFWAYITAVNTGSSPTSGNCMWESTGNLGERFSLHMLTISSTPTLVWAVNFGGDSFSHQTALTLNSWQHIAVVRNVSTWNLYIDGVQSTTSKTGYGTIMTNSNFYIIGPRQDSETKLYIDDFRHTTGVARYTSTFTPPTQAFPDS